MAARICEGAALLVRVQNPEPQYGAFWGEGALTAGASGVARGDLTRCVAAASEYEVAVCATATSSFHDVWQMNIASVCAAANARLPLRLVNDLDPGFSRSSARPPWQTTHRKGFSRSFWTRAPACPGRVRGGGAMARSTLPLRARSTSARHGSSLSSGTPRIAISPPFRARLPTLGPRGVLHLGSDALPRAVRGLTVLQWDPHAGIREPTSEVGLRPKHSRRPCGTRW